MLFLRENIAYESLIDFFESSLPKSFFEISQWFITDQQKVDIILKIQELGYVYFFHFIIL